MGGRTHCGGRGTSRNWSRWRARETTSVGVVGVRVRDGMLMLEGISKPSMERRRSGTTTSGRMLCGGLLGGGPNEPGDQGICEGILCECGRASGASATGIKPGMSCECGRG